MHELILTQSILNIALTEASKHRASKVVIIRIKSGVLAGVLPSLVKEYFSIASAGTVAEAAQLIIESVPAVISCLDCGSRNTTESIIFNCPSCKSSRIRLLDGREFYVDSLEIEN